VLRVVGLSLESEARWDEFVAAHPAGLLYHSLRFRDFLLDLLGCRASYALALADDGVVRGVMPLVGVDGPYGRVLNSLAYFGSPGGVLARDPAARAALEAWYAQEVAAPEVGAGTVVQNPFDAGGRAVVHDATDTRVCHVTALTGDGELPASIEPSARRNVAKARREGIEVEVENDDALGALASLHREGMEAIGAPAKTDAFFEAVRRHFRPGVDYEVYVARLGGRAVAALLVFHFGETVEYYVPASDLEHRSLQPLAAILAEAMPAAARRGARRWNWGGSRPSQETLMRFKAKWGGQPCEYSYWVTVNSPELVDAEPEELLAAYPGFYVRPFEPAGAAAGATR
jgi:Acetyltransferase (GNAT) domain